MIMANWYTTNYVFVGDKEDVNALYDKLKEIEKSADSDKGGDFGTHWLGIVVETLGESVKEIPCRGEWYNLEKRDDKVYFDTCTANGTCNGIMDLICDYYESLKYFYRCDGPEPETNDRKGKYFDKFKIELSTPESNDYKGQQFSDEKYFKTKEDAFKWLSEIIGREISSEEDIENVREEWEENGDFDGNLYFMEYEYISRESELGSRFFQDMFWRSNFSDEDREDEE